MAKRSHKTPLWQEVENVVAAIEKVRGSVPGMIVTQKVQLPRLSDPSDTRDIDVFVEVPIGDRLLRIAVEVKNKHRPLTIEQMGCIVDLRRDVAVDRFCVVSTSGYSGAAKKKAAENDIELATLQEFEVSEFWAYLPGTTVIKTSGEFLHIQFDFSEAILALHSEALQVALGGTKHDAIVLADDTGSTSVPNFLNEVLLGHNKSVLADIKHGDEFRFFVDLSRRNNVTVTVNGQTFPGPDSMTVTARLSRIIQHVSERRFRFRDIEINTAEMNLFGSPEQVTLLKVPQKDGSVQLVLSRGPAVPKRVTK